MWLGGVSDGEGVGREVRRLGSEADHLGPYKPLEGLRL